MSEQIHEWALPPAVYNHIRIQPDDTLVCLYCGETYQMTMPAPVPMLSAMLRAWSGAHRDCTLTPDRLVIIRLGWDAQFKSHEAWILGTDRGRSSETLWNHFTGRHEPNPCMPSDPSDFGRCHRLLRAFPEWRVRLQEVGHRYPGWGPVVRAWRELEVLFEGEVPNFMEWNAIGVAPKTYARMKELGL